MKLEDLSASELAEIDAVCLEFERRLSSEEPMSVDDAIKSFVGRAGVAVERKRIELLRQELEAIEEEIRQRALSDAGGPDSAPTPFQPKTATANSGTASSSREGNVDSGRSEKVKPRRVERSGGSSREAGTKSSPNRAGTADTDWISGSGATPTSRGGGRSENDELPVQSIGPYSLGSVLARGGMGVVYQAVDTRLDRAVAIKMLGFPNLAPTDPKRIELVERFEREAKAVAALSHPNIVELFDVGVVGDLPYAVMEFLSGMTLAQQLSVGAMSAEQTRQIGMQVAGALATAHAEGVIHRDLKPQNVILIDSQDFSEDSIPRVKLLDFGLSRVNDAGMFNDGNDTSQTRSGTILGTPGYMAPEQARGESATTAADMFGLGCVLYEVFHGKPAIPGDTPADRLAGTLRDEIQYEHSNCEKSRVLCELIADCLDKDPAKRPSAATVYERLRQFDLAGNTPRGTPGDCSSKPAADSGKGMLRRHALTAVAGGVLGGLFGGLSLGSSNGKHDGIQMIAVLTIRNRNTSTNERGSNGRPLEDRKLSDGDILSSVLVNELAAIDGFAVVPYQPQSASTTEEYIELGKELGVDALLAGSFETQTVRQKEFWVLNWQLIKAADGSLLEDGQSVVERDGSNPGTRFLAQSTAASDIASQIGRALVTSGKKHGAPDPMAYGCMMKGHAYADADSKKGLRQALLCFGKAHEEDPRLSEPLASIALASLNLASRSDSREEALKHLEKARSSITDALALESNSLKARLAEAMLQWQALQHYEEAYWRFNELSQRDGLNWQIEHQFGLLLTALGEGETAVYALRAASKLNPRSILVKTDLCRAHWFFDWESRAVRDAIRYRDELSDEHPAKKLVLGFLVDVYESQRDYAKAAEVLGLAAIPSGAAEYFEQREPTLSEIPYGPFGAILNRALFDQRRGETAEPDEEVLGRLDDSGATMFSLILARHPAMSRLRSTPAAEGYLPTMNNRKQSVS